jgi:hypothetical protein
MQTRRNSMQQDDIIQKVLADLQAEFGAELLGVLATGSRIHGTPGVTSDLDLHVVISAPRRQRRNRVVDGLEVEMFINPPFQIRHYLQDGRGAHKHQFTFGHVVYDPHEVIAALRSEAAALWHAGPAPVGAGEAWQHHYFPADLLRDLQDIDPADEATAVLLIARTVEQLLKSQYRLQGRWIEKTKRLLADLQQWDPTAARLVRAALASGPLAKRIEALQQLAAHVLAPIGGVMPLAWESEWEELQAQQCRAAEVP